MLVRRHKPGLTWELAFDDLILHHVRVEHLAFYGLDVLRHQRRHQKLRFFQGLLEVFHENCWSERNG